MFGSKDEIILCRECQIPLIWTFFFAYAEYYCLNCGDHEGMMGAGDRVKATPELKRQLRRLTKLWKAIAHRMNPLSSYTRGDCKKCSVECDHRLHLSRKEKLEHKAVMPILESLKGTFSFN